ncbi:MAG: hypothetical protein IPK14_09510 [Blastocatellia bacterium]|nr:hypothetical protein [Blastocatellia bacterium]MBL8197012.1 hypothetical protein [Blastocatellia bacterium]MBN8724545.1 hypothetical protein [Acidobacteriota bacterium]
MLCPNCGSFTSNPNGHNAWACISILKERNLRLQKQVTILEDQINEVKADLHATEAVLEMELVTNCKKRSF